MADVFVSYKRDDRRVVQRIVEELRRAGLSVWWDADIGPDAPWESTIEEQLDKARAVVVAWSQSSAASENVKAEARKARSDGRLIQVYIGKCEPPLFFGERQGVDLSNWSGSPDDAAFGAIVRAATGLAGKSPQARPQGAKTRRGRSWHVVAIPFVIALGLLGIWVARESGFVRSNSERTRTLGAIAGSWGRPGCPSPQRFSVSDGVITVQARGWTSTGRVISVEGGVVLSETLSPLADRGRLIELRPQGDQLVLHDKTTDVRQVLERCQ